MNYFLFQRPEWGVSAPIELELQRVVNSHMCWNQTWVFCKSWSPHYFLNIKSEIWCLVYIYSLSLFRLTSCLELSSYVCLVPALLSPWNRAWQLWWFLRDCHTSYMVTNLPRVNCPITSSSKLIYTSSLRWCQRIGSHSYLIYTSLNNIL